MQKSVFFSVVLVVSSGLAGCQKSEATPSASTSASASAEPVAATGAAAPSASAAKGLPPACLLIKKTELEGVLHDTFDEPVESKYTAGICEFKHKGSNLPTLGVTIL